MMIDNIPEMSEHMVNTERVTTADRGMAHKEGGEFLWRPILCVIFRFENFT